MKVLMVNGSPKSKGNTAAALAEVGAALEGHGIEWEVFQLGAAPVRDCIGCGKCAELDCACVFDDDMVNELIKAAQQADGFIFGTPVYYAHPTGRILSVLDRAFYAGGAAFEHKPGGDCRGSSWRHHGIVRRAQQIFHYQTDACCGVDLLEWRARTRAGRSCAR